MSTKQKICLVIPSLNAGGMERVMSELANYFSAKESIHTTLISLSNSEEFFKLNEQVEFLKPDFKFNASYRLLSTIKLLFFLRRKLRFLKPDAVLSFGETYNSFVLLSAVGLGLNIFVSDRSKPNKDWGFLHNRLRRFLYPLAKGLICQTTYSKHFLFKETGHQNIAIIPNPVKIPDTIDHERQNVILTVGRLIPSKQVNLLIEIYHRLNNKNWDLWIIGDGPARKELEQISKNFGLEKQVKFWGYQDNINGFYGRASIFAFTSNSEGFPNSILEAMVAGLPVIAFDCIAGPADLIKHNATGLLIKPGNIKGFQEGLSNLMDHPDLRIKLGASAKKTSSNFNISIIGEEYLNFLLS